MIIMENITIVIGCSLSKDEIKGKFAIYMNIYIKLLADNFSFNK